MTFAVLTNFATMILCIAVLIQTMRLMRALDTVKGGALTEVVGALDASTGEARRVLGKLTELMRGDVAGTARTLSEGKSMIEELTVMTGIGNAIAERIVEAAGANNRANAATASLKPAARPRKRPEDPKDPAAPGSTEDDTDEPRRRSRRPARHAGAVAA